MIERNIHHSAMGSPWSIRIYSGISPALFGSVVDSVKGTLNNFEAAYSRFTKDSIVAQLSQHTGPAVVPESCIDMLRMCMAMYAATDGKMNPCIGGTIEDLGYDADYSFKPKLHIRQTPYLLEALSIDSETIVTVKQKVLLDFGAVGKGYAMREVAECLESHGIDEYLIDGSGDLLHKGSKSITVGLEHPKDANKVIGTVCLHNESLASSGVSRRSWGNGIHHIVDARSGLSTKNTQAAWVRTNDPAWADILATGHMLAHSPALQDVYNHEYLIVDDAMTAMFSRAFHAELF